MIHRGAALVLLASLLLGACGESNPEPTASIAGQAGLAELLGPYQTVPYREFDENLIRSLEEVCTADMFGGFVAKPDLALADVRGDGRIMLVYDAGDGDTAECLARIDANGTASVDGAGSYSGGDPVRLGALEILASSSGSTGGEESWTYLYGSAGSEIGGVVIALADGTSITASVGGGRFAAWWPSEAQPTRIRGFDRGGRQVADQPY